MKSIGKYQALEELGQSAAGITYRVRDGFRNREFALKVLTPVANLDRAARDRFCGDLSNCAELVHRQLVKVHDLGEVDAAIYMATELLSGTDLRRFMHDNPSLPVGQKIGIAAQVAEGLAFVHSREVAHGNLKPANIFVDAARNATILDLGIGKWQASVLAAGHRLEGLLPNYLAPEQVLGQPFDARSDLFSLGLMLYEFLAGKYPFPVAPSLIPREIVHGEIEPLRKVDPQIPEALEQLVAKVLHKNPEQRLQTAEEFAAGLYAVAQQIRRAEAAAAVAEPPAPVPPPPPVQATAFETPKPAATPAPTPEAPPVPASESVPAPPAPSQRAAAPTSSVVPAGESKPAAAEPQPVAAAPQSAPDAPAASNQAPKAASAAVPPVQPAVKPPRAGAPAPAAKPAPARPPVKPLPASKPSRLSKRTIAIAAGAILAVSIVATFVSRQSLKASQSKNQAPAAVSAPVVQAVKPAGTPAMAPAPPAPEPAEPAPNAAASAEPLAKRILSGNVRPLWEAGKYTEALGLVNQVLAVDPENAEARAWRKKIRDAQAAEAAIK